jgi:hypothetical protein
MMRNHMARSALILATAVMLGMPLAAQAANDNQSRDRGGFDIGPMGQCFDPAACGQTRVHRSARYWNGREGYAYAPRYYYHGHWHDVR